MNRRNLASPLIRCALGIAFLALFASASSASVIYEYRELDSTAVIGTLELMAPPASSDSAWNTANASDVISLFLDDDVFGLGDDDLLLASGVFSVFDAIASLDGSKLDSGAMGITFSTIFPSDPADPTIERTLVFGFGVPAGGDSIALSTVSRFPDGGVVIGDLFVDGDWTVAPDAAVPEPGTFTLLGMGLLAAGRSVLRRRNVSACGAERSSTSHHANMRSNFLEPQVLT